ncbi:MAG: transporter [Alphaproteobacteria bacterium]|nr:transporter [Alphaproteobacteria bacterium]MBV9371112.1 transporter [Alphaproteobacteria bacterium]MBV9901514.1 transporter [Alphaproteobacteria bacterium]
MTGRIAILTPDATSEGFRTRWPDVLERNAAPLRAAGLSVEARDWASASDLPGFDLVLPLLVWGYPFAPDQWLAAVDLWEAQGVRLANPAPVLRWNADKAYLGTLAGRGAPVVPTRYVDALTERALADSAAAFGTGRLVAKPRISSSGWQTIRWSPGSGVEGGPEGAAMIQPYLPAIEAQGEASLFYFGGRYSHAVSKRPQPGEFRVQPEYDGIIAAYRPEPEERQAAERVLAAVEEDLLYARIDLVRGPDGKPALIELELIEPDLYLGYDPEAGGRFAAAVEERIGR